MKTIALLVTLLGLGLVRSEETVAAKIQIPGEIAGPLTSFIEAATDDIGLIQDLLDDVRAIFESAGKENKGKIDEVIKLNLDIAPKLLSEGIRIFNDVRAALGALAGATNKKELIPDLIFNSQFGPVVEKKINAVKSKIPGILRGAAPVKKVFGVIDSVENAARSSKKAHSDQYVHLNKDLQDSIALFNEAKPVLIQDAELLKNSGKQLKPFFEKVKVKYLPKFSTFGKKSSPALHTLKLALAPAKAAAKESLKKTFKIRIVQKKA